jgi:hypothetical protein
MPKQAVNEMDQVPSLYEKSGLSLDDLGAEDERCGPQVGLTVIEQDDRPATKHVAAIRRRGGDYAIRSGQMTAPAPKRRWLVTGK